MRKRLFTALLLLCLIAMHSETLAAGYSLSIPPVMQEKSNWCWAAVGNRILWWFGYRSPQCSIHFAAQLNCLDTQDTLGGINQALYLLAGLNGTYVDTPLDWEIFRMQLERNQPVAVRWLWNTGGGHIVLATGYRYDGEYRGPRYVDYIDPHDATRNEVPWTWFHGGPGTGSDHIWTHSLYDFR